MKASLSRSLPRGGAAVLVVAPLLVAVLPSCGSSPSGGSTWPKGNVVFHAENNYPSTTSLTIPVVPAMHGTDLMVCWDMLMKDLLCHTIAQPNNGIDNVG